MLNDEIKVNKQVGNIAEIKMNGGDDLNAVYRDAFMIHGSLTEIIIDFGNLNKRTMDGQANARERVALSPAVAAKLAESLQASLGALQKHVAELAAAQQLSSLED